ncbi:MAG TPA: ABC transporter, partial [Clostridiaceae bacterium]|nr:ABC transporter [Clostridiaceae bacterium]
MKHDSGVKRGTLKRLLKMLFEYYPVMLPVALFCIIFSAVVSSIPAIFMQNIISIVEKNWKTAQWSAIAWQILRYISL